MLHFRVQIELLFLLEQLKKQRINKRIWSSSTKWFLEPDVRYAKITGNYPNPCRALFELTFERIISAAIIYSESVFIRLSANISAIVLRIRFSVYHQHSLFANSFEITWRKRRRWRQRLPHEWPPNWERSISSICCNSWKNRRKKTRSPDENERIFVEQWLRRRRAKRNEWLCQILCARVSVALFSSSRLFVYCVLRVRVIRLVLQWFSAHVEKMFSRKKKTDTNWNDDQWPDDSLLVTNEEYQLTWRRLQDFNWDDRLIINLARCPFHSITAADRDEWETILIG